MQIQGQVSYLFKFKKFTTLKKKRDKFIGPINKKRIDKAIEKVNSVWAISKQPFHFYPIFPYAVIKQRRNHIKVMKR
jgi:hypothetical protein